MRCTMADIDAVQRIFDELGIEGDAYNMLAMAQVYLLMPHPDSLFMVVPESKTSGVAHTHVIGNRRGLGGIRDAKQAVYWIFQNTSLQEIHGFTPENLAHALRFNACVGFKKRGVLPDSHEEGGFLYDRIVYSVTKDEWINRQ